MLKLLLVQTTLFMLTLLGGILSFANDPDWSRVSEAAKSKCQNTHGNSQKYNCSYTVSGELLSMVRLDLRENSNKLVENNYYKSKFVTLYPGEIIDEVTEYREDGTILRKLNFDRLGILLNEKKYNLFEKLIVEENFENSLSRTVDNTINHHLVERHFYTDGVYARGMELGGYLSPVSERRIIDQVKIFGKNKQLVQFFDNNYTNSCPVKSSQSIKVIVFEETGVDVDHPLFRGQIYSHGKEVIDGVDNDGNGLIDDCGGFSVTNRQSNKTVVDPQLAENQEIASIEHGTQVVDVLLKNNDLISILPVSGDLKNKKYYDFGRKIISSEEIHFANMSLQFRPESHRGGSDKLFRSIVPNLKKMIKDSSKTLFVVGAGNGFYGFGANNGGTSIDVNKDHYPAALRYNNILVVGSINTNDASLQSSSDYKLSKFSNYGLNNVDVLAPGEKIDLALPGGLARSKDSGTSLAAPFVLNVLTQAKSMYPELSIYQLKELAMKTVYIPSIDVALEHSLDNSSLLHRKKRVRDEYLSERPMLMPVRSGGVFYPSRFLLAAKYLSQDRMQNVNNSVFMARTEINLKLDEENMSENYKNKLIKLWDLRKIN